MSDSFIGEIRAFAIQYAPLDWAECNGQQLSVAANQALFSLISYNFGGSGSYFNLPDLRDIVPMGVGAGPQLTPRQYLQTGGSATVGLTPSNLPLHNHIVKADTVVDPESNDPANKYPSADDTNFVYIKELNPALEVAMHPSALSTAGAGSPHENRQPGMALIYCICLSGVYPTRP